MALQLEAVQSLKPGAGFDGFAQDYAAIPVKAELQGPGGSGCPEAQPGHRPSSWLLSHDSHPVSLDQYQPSCDFCPWSCDLPLYL